MKKLIIIICCCLIVLTSVFIIFPPTKIVQKHNLGVWWWDKQLDTSIYLDYAYKNKVTEIYYCDSSFNENTKNFINLCNKKNINVYFLCGEYQWLNDNTNLINKLNLYVEYQNNNPNQKFAGVHLDIEPHQDPNFDSNRTNLIYSLIELAYSLNNLYPNIKFDYDIPFWLNDEIAFNGNTKPAFKHIIDIANKVTIMSYRDTAEKIYSVAFDEIEYAKSINKTINLAVECGNTGEDIVDFHEEGKIYLNNELKKLHSLIPKQFGIIIHHIESWYNLQ